jgi:ABC-type amino acid transport substrate-binding protein/ABC-type amino acid transport system permease subunit
MKRVLSWLFALVLVGVGGTVLAQSTGAAPGANCAILPEALARVQCTGVLRIGVRTNYPPFAYKMDDALTGFEIDLARQLASMLGLKAELTVVTPANRIALLGEKRIDLTIATMGHTVQRDREVLFVRPHYYLSQTVVVGRKEFAVTGLDDVRGKTICVTVGNSTNADLSANGARLMLFDTAPRLVDELRLGGCSLAAQDDSFFAAYFQQSGFAAANSVKFGFAPLPWGAAVAREGGQALADSLAAALKTMHADGSLQRLAEQHGVASPFLVQQQAAWAGDCANSATPAGGNCLLSPRDNQLQPTLFAVNINALEARILEASGLKMTLAMFKTQVAMSLFIDGVVFSLLLVAGAVLATLGLAAAFGAVLSANSPWLRWPARLVLMVMQSTPLILLMILAGVLLSALGTSSPYSALAAAVLMLGLSNGSNAGQAVAEAMTSLRQESPAAAPTLAGAMHRASAQLVAFMVNATRGSPAASVMGVPELLSALTDIASFSSERITTYTLLLVFYMAVVAAVVWLGNHWVSRMQRSAKLCTGVAHA